MPGADRAGELTVRPATAADIDVIARIHTSARSAYYRGFVPEESLADPAAGTAPRLVRPAELLQIHVRPDRWRRGIGSALHRASVEVWQAGSVTTARVDVWARNDQGRAFYASHGWQPDGHRREGPAGFDFIRLVLAIPPDGINIADELARFREDER